MTEHRESLDSDRQAVAPGAYDDAWFRQVAESAGDVFFVIRTSPDIAVEYLSDAADILFGYPASAVLSDPQLFISRVDPRDWPELERVLGWAPGQEQFHELRWVHRDGRPITTLSWVRSVRRADGSIAIEGNARDISELRSAEQTRLLFEDRYRLMAESANIVLWTMALDGTITYVSPSVEQMRGFTPQEAMNQPLDEILTPESQQIVAAYYTDLYAALAEGRAPEPFRCEQEYLCKDGSTIWTEVEVLAYLGPDRQVMEILGITRDIADRKQVLDDLHASRDELDAANAALTEANARLEYLSVTDPLTGAWNRRHGERILSADLDEARRYGPSMSLLLLDIDRFKAINDTFGHQTGDRVLIEITQRLQSNLRTSDALARWGGEEFVIMARQCTLGDATALAEKLRDIIRETPFADGGNVTVSIGVAELKTDDDLSTWLSRADRALYSAKNAGRDAVRGLA